MLMSILGWGGWFGWALYPPLSRCLLHELLHWGIARCKAEANKEVIHVCMFVLGGFQLSPQLFSPLVFSGDGFPFNPLKDKLLAGDLKTDSQEKNLAFGFVYCAPLPRP